MAAIGDTLRTLRDVQGVYGSFVIAANGTLVGRDLPAAFDNDVFAEVGPRITRLYETFLSGAEELEGCMLRYAEHKLYLRKMTWGIVGVLSAVSVNMPALRMVANLVIRRIDPDVVPSLRPTLTPRPVSVDTPLPLMQPTASLPRFPMTSTSDPPPVTTASSSSEGSEPPSSASPTSRPTRMYRGRPVSD